MFSWFKNKIVNLSRWLWDKIRQVGLFIKGLFSRRAPSPTPTTYSPSLSPMPTTHSPSFPPIDFTSYIKDGQKHHSPSFARMYDMSAKRRWEWLKNLIALKKWKPQKRPSYNPKILALFSQREADLQHTDLSFDRNPIPLNEGTDFINHETFNQYLMLLAHHRNYHLFAQVLLQMLKNNSVSTYALLNDLTHTNHQLIEQGFFDKPYTLLYIPEKSQQWVGSLLYRIMPEKPQEIRELDVDGPRVEKSCHNQLLICDDICYTGTQAMNFLSQIRRTYPSSKITMVFGRMSIYALSELKEHINFLQKNNPNYPNDSINIIVGTLFNTVSAQLDSLPNPPTIYERHIFMQLLEANYEAPYRKGNLRRKPLLTTGWKKPDFVSSYFYFTGLDKKGPDCTLISAALLKEPPSKPITFFSPNNKPDHSLKIKDSLISGPTPPYHSAIN